MNRFAMIIMLVVALHSHQSFAQLSPLRSSLNSYSDLVHGTYLEAYKRALHLQQAIRSFIETPSVMTQTTAKEAWKHARESYGQTEAFRFYNGPIDRDGGPEGELNSWPLDESYIDYTVGALDSGIINNLKSYPEISKELLLSLNELDGEKNVSVGYHAIEFLLWGQDFYTDSPGQRSFEDYTINPNAKRRAEYLKIITDLLVEDLSELEFEWRPETQNYRSEFAKLTETQALKKVLSGIIFLAGDELSGERMYVAYDTQGQEDEHSCFSDMTHMDIQWNYQGVVNVIQSMNLLKLPEINDSALAKKIDQRLINIESLLKSIPAPFDQAIVSEEGRPLILQSVEELEALAKDLVEVSILLNARVDY